MRSSVFIASSSEQLAVAEAIEMNLSSTSLVTSWKHAFRPGRSFFSELMELRDKFDFAIILLTADDVSRVRGVDYAISRDNLIFELGLFLGSIGQERVFAILDQRVDTKIISDYAGVKFITYDGDRAKREPNQALSACCIEIRQIIDRVGPREQVLEKKSVLFPGEMIGLETLYDNMSSAERNLLSDLRDDPGPIRLFFHIASQNIGLKGTLFDTLDVLAQEGRVDLRILHATPDSPLFSRDRLISIGKRPERVTASLKQVFESLNELEVLAASSLRRRTHDHPFIWRVYALSNKLYFMPYFSDRDATKKSPVLVFRKGPSSLYQTFVEWFDYVWEKAAPQRVKLSDLISPVAPSGAGLFARWEGRHVFAIPKRDIIKYSGHVRFYGLGGKRADRDESFTDCALREGNEESSNSISRLVTSEYTDYIRNDGAISRVNLTGDDIIPRVVLEKRAHSGFGAMKKEDDSYFIVAYDAELSKKPLPSNEVAAILFIPETILVQLADGIHRRLSDLLAGGAEIFEQEGMEIPRSSVMIAYGLALYLIRNRN